MHRSRAAALTDRHSELGETLAEVLVTVAIVGLAIVILVGALADSILASSNHRQHATADTVARSVAERIKGTPWAATYPKSGWNDLVPSGFSAEAPTYCLPANSAVPVTISSASADSTFTNENCAGDTAGLQLVTITVTSNVRGNRERVEIVKRTTAPE